MRIRTIKPEFFHHEGLFTAEQETELPLRVAFCGIWCAADREGRFKWEPRRLGIQILPYDGVDFSRVLDALVTRGFLVKYACNGDWFGLVPSFIKHQVINNRESQSILPDPNSENSEIISIQEASARVNHESVTRESREEHADSVEGKGRERKGKEVAPSSPWVVAYGLELPESLRTQNCLDAAKLWIDYKKEKKQGYKSIGLKATMTKWATDFTAATFPISVETSIASNWSGVFAAREQKSSGVSRNQNGQIDYDKMTEKERVQFTIG